MLKHSLVFSASTVIFSLHVQAADLVPFTSYQDLRQIESSKGSFSEELARQYKDFALFEAEEMYDWPDADYFAEKALRAEAREPIEPEDPSDWGISQAHLAELESGRAELIRLLDAGGRERIPQLAALAQAKFDCWVEQQEEGHQPEHIAACREGFNSALAELETATAENKATESPKVTASEEVARMVVYFDWDKAKITSDGQAELDKLVSEMRDMQNTVLFVEGHADRSGSATYNEKLSESRAQNVRAELIAQGMNVASIEEMKISAKGETEPAVQTGDGVKEQANRRVEIVVRGLVAASEK